jgi:hypothetical protein
MKRAIPVIENGSFYNIFVLYKTYHPQGPFLRCFVRLLLDRMLCDKVFIQDVLNRYKITTKDLVFQKKTINK